MKCNRRWSLELLPPGRTRRRARRGRCASGNVELVPGSRDAYYSAILSPRRVGTLRENLFLFAIRAVN
ncbi:hypothetical protein chiPu_0014774 [Chiloscyllium punctatum]|uniref:Uncharacterized protein n=1 Tax=Chiloscyllium punctatum TaxID=137246 RepID=A0A401T0X8_CHIPU|nr:hypothetical protein [Chiloscyllium punctatum]